MGAASSGVGSGTKAHFGVPVPAVPPPPGSGADFGVVLGGEECTAGVVVVTFVVLLVDTPLLVVLSM